MPCPELEVLHELCSHRVSISVSIQELHNPGHRQPITSSLKEDLHPVFPSTDQLVNIELKSKLSVGPWCHRG